MRRRLQDLMNRFDNLSLRERVLVMAAILGLVVLIWDSQLMGPLEQGRKQRQAAMAQMLNEVGQLENAVAEIAHTGAEDPERELREQAAQLQSELLSLDQQLQGLTTGLIAPQQMTRVLEEMLERKSSLELIGLRTLPAEPILTSPVAALAAAAAAAVEAPRIYKHGVELTFTGTYLETLRFLTAMEELDWRMFWDRIELSVERHPQATIRLTLYTLSLREGWIGV